MPGQFTVFNSKIGQLDVGKAGKNGLLQVTLEKKPGGRTVVADMRSQVPLTAQRAIYHDGSDLAYLYIASVSGGVLQGDRYRMDITAKKDSQAHITTQGATRIYGMDSNSATQMINITLHENAYLEFIPDQIIPYKGSRFYQRLDMNVHDEATLIYSEILTPGRTAMGESFAYDICYLKTQAYNHNGESRFSDIASIEPQKMELASFGVLGGYAVVASVYILTKKGYVGELTEEINDILRRDGIFGGASQMRDGTGIMVRILDNDTAHIKDSVYRIVAVLRKKITGNAFYGIRKN